MDATILLWSAVTLFIVEMLALHLLVFHRHAHAVSLREAAVVVGILAVTVAASIWQTRRSASSPALGSTAEDRAA